MFRKGSLLRYAIGIILQNRNPVRNILGGPKLRLLKYLYNHTLHLPSLKTSIATTQGTCTPVAYTLGIMWCVLVKLDGIININNKSCVMHLRALKKQRVSAQIAGCRSTAASHDLGRGSCEMGNLVLGGLSSRMSALYTFFWDI